MKRKVIRGDLLISKESLVFMDLGKFKLSEEWHLIAYRGSVCCHILTLFPFKYPSTIALVMVVCVWGGGGGGVAVIIVALCNTCRTLK